MNLSLVFNFEVLNIQSLKERGSIKYCNINIIIYIFFISFLFLVSMEKGVKWEEKVIRSNPSEIRMVEFKY